MAPYRKRGLRLSDQEIDAQTAYDEEYGPHSTPGASGYAPAAPGYRGAPDHPVDEYDRAVKDIMTELRRRNTSGQDNSSTVYDDFVRPQGRYFKYYRLNDRFRGQAFEDAMQNIYGNDRDTTEDAARNQSPEAVDHRRRYHGF